MKKHILIYLLILFFLPLYSALSQLESYYDVIPDLPTCKEGTLKDAEKQKVLNEINNIRMLHGLKAVTYDYTKDILEQKSALIDAANDTLTHTPTSALKCWSQDGTSGSGSSNLFINWSYGTFLPTSESSVYNWMMDTYTEVCGHRRWILDPFVKFIAFGRVDGASKKNAGFNVSGMSLYVIDNNKQENSDLACDFVAYPYQNYPIRYVFDNNGKYWYLSFTAIFDKSNYWNNSNVDYTKATVTMVDASNNPVPVTNLQFENDGYGTPNFLKWNISNLQQDMKYTVTVNNVTYKGNTKNYTYWFKVTDQVGDSPDVPTLATPADKAINIDTTVKLTWNAAKYAETYSLQVATDNAFSNIINTEDNLSTTYFQLPNLNDSTKYFWKVLSVNSIGSSDWSNIWSFTTKQLPPKKPTLTGPVNNAGYVALDATLHWNTVPKATSYHVQVADGPGFSSFGLYVDKENILTNSYSIPLSANLASDKTYWWRVSAKNSLGYGGWSDVYYFSTGAPVDVTDPVAANTIIMITPNPFADKAKLLFNFDRDSKVSIQLYSPTGQIVKTFLTNEFYQKGEYSLDINSSELSTGVYFFKFVINDEIISRPVSIIK